MTELYTTQIFDDDDNDDERIHRQIPIEIKEEEEQEQQAEQRRPVAVTPHNYLRATNVDDQHLRRRALNFLSLVASAMNRFDVRSILQERAELPHGEKDLKRLLTYMLNADVIYKLDRIDELWQQDAREHDMPTTSMEAPLFAFVAVSRNQRLRSSYIQAFEMRNTREMRSRSSHRGLDKDIARASFDTRLAFAVLVKNFKWRDDEFRSQRDE